MKLLFQGLHKCSNKYGQLLFDIPHIFNMIKDSSYKLSNLDKYLLKRYTEPSFEILPITPKFLFSTVRDQVSQFFPKLKKVKNPCDIDPLHLKIRYLVNQSKEELILNYKKNIYKEIQKREHTVKFNTYIPLYLGKLFEKNHDEIYLCMNSEFNWAAINRNIGFNLDQLSFLKQGKLKKILKILEFDGDEYTLIDLIRLSNNELLDSIEISLHKQNTIPKLHNFLASEYSKMKNYNYKLNQNIPLSKFKIENKKHRFQIRPAKDNHELIDWGIKLNHCVGTYGDRVKNKECLIFGYFIEKTLIYTIEYSSKVIQVQGQNTYPSKQELNKIKLFFKKIYGEPNEI